MATVLVVDDEQSVQESFKIILGDEHRVLTTDGGSSALSILEREQADVVLLDIIMPDMHGVEVLRRIKQMPNPPEVVMITATRTVKTAVEAMKLGAYDYITKPFDVDELKEIVNKAVEKQGLVKEVTHLRNELNKTYRLDNFIATSPKMQEILHQIEQLAPTRTSVLLHGENGTGKEVLARALHYHPANPRRTKPFIAVDCNTLPDTLIESELFGHEKGAFTGAETKIGRVELADGGTLFLDEIGEIPQSTQVKLLRFLEDRKFMRLGSTTFREVDVRIVAATNRDLGKSIKEGKFREDLYYRINVVPIHIPPLRERKEDIPLLVEFYSEKYAREMGIKKKRFAPDVMERFMTYSWPGNVRQLKNIVERLSILCPNEEVTLADLPEIILESNSIEQYKQEVFSGRMSLEDAENAFLREMIISALKQANGVQTRAAEILKTSRRTLKYQMDKLGITAQLKEIKD